MPYTRLAIHEVSRPVESGCEWKPWKRFRWLEPLFKMLWSWLSQPYMEEAFSYKTVVIEHDTIRGLIAESQQNLYRITGRDNCRHVIVGPKQFYGVMDELCTSVASIGMNMEIGRNRIVTIYGLTVHCIPWFDGVLLLPDLKEQR